MILNRICVRGEYLKNEIIVVSCLRDSLTKNPISCYASFIGDVLASTLVVKLFDACRERIISRKSILHFNSRKRRNVRFSSLTC